MVSGPWQGVGSDPAPPTAVMICPLGYITPEQAERNAS
jgi:hypothetical protein